MVAYTWAEFIDDGIIYNATIPSSASLMSEEIDNSGKLGAWISLECVYDSVVAQAGLVCFVLPIVAENSNVFADKSDNVIAYRGTYALAALRYVTFFVAGSIPGFRILVENESGASVVGVTLRYKHAVA